MNYLNIIDELNIQNAYIRFHGQDEDILDRTWMSGHVCAMCEDDDQNCDDLCSVSGDLSCQMNPDGEHIVGILGAKCSFEIQEGSITSNTIDYEQYESFTIFEGREISASELDIPEGCYVVPTKVLYRSE